MKKVALVQTAALALFVLSLGVTSTAFAKDRWMITSQDYELKGDGEDNGTKNYCKFTSQRDVHTITGDSNAFLEDKACVVQLLASSDTCDIQIQDPGAGSMYAKISSAGEFCNSLTISTDDTQGEYAYVFTVLPARSGKMPADP